MSNNIDNVKMLSSELSIEAKDAARFADECEDRLPEDCFLYDIGNLVSEALRAGDPARLIPIKKLTWRGCASGHLFDTLVREICPRLRGKGEIVFQYENGWLRGLSIDCTGEKPKIEERNVEMVLT